MINFLTKDNGQALAGLMRDDKIFASKEHWTGSGADVGTGSSDHSAIIANLSR